MRVSSVALDSSKDFLLAKAPVLPYSIARKLLCRPFAQASIDPGHGHLQQLGNFVNGEKKTFVSLLSLSGHVS